jgi:hypothetical protein
MKTKKMFVAILLCITIGAPLMFYGYLYFIRYGDHWKQRTTPLPRETVAILCTNFALDKNHLLCSAKEDVYGPDFYKIIRDTFRPYEAYEIASNEAATFDEVDEKIGMFKYECEPVVYQADGFTYFNCLYDLHGDREFIMGIMFTYPDNAVFRINTPMGFDGE